MIPTCQHRFPEHWWDTQDWNSFFLSPLLRKRLRFQPLCISLPTLILACFKRIHGDVTGSTLLQWHQCCLPTKIPARTTVRWFFVCSLGHNWSSMSSVQHFCHPVPNSWSRISASTPVWEPWGMAAARSLLVSGSGSGNVHYWHSGEGGGA